LIGLFERISNAAQGPEVKPIKTSGWRLLLEFRGLLYSIRF